MPDQSQVIREQLDRLVNAFNAHDADKVMNCFDDDCEFYASRGNQPHGQRFVGKQAVGDAFRERFAAVPDLRFSDGEHWISGNRAVSSWRVTGTLSNGERLDCHGCDLWVFRNGKVVSKDTYYKQVIG